MYYVAGEGEQIQVFGGRLSQLFAEGFSRDVVDALLLHVRLAVLDEVDAALDHVAIPLVVEVHVGVRQLQHAHRGRQTIDADRRAVVGETMGNVHCQLFQVPC